MAVDRNTWRPPPALIANDDPTRVRGALAGSLLYDQPAHAEQAARIRAFVNRPQPLALEIGFDHGMRLLDHARRFPQINWLGVEIRKARVEAASPHAPPNALLERGDARTLLAALIPPGRLDFIYVLFPTPADNPKHLLFTPAFVHQLATALAPEGRLYAATDVPAMGDYIADLLQDWPEAPAVPLGPVLSRRERMAIRDTLPVWRFCRHKP